MALETCTSAAGAVDKICDFIEKNHTCDKSDMPKYGFVICDNREAWILNVAGKFWAAELVSGKTTLIHMLLAEYYSEYICRRVPAYSSRIFGNNKN